MNFKKFISGVSALAIAASAFAGISAMAAEQIADNLKTSVDYTAAGAENDWTVGTYSGAGPTITVTEGTGIVFASGYANNRTRSWNASASFDQSYTGDVTVTASVTWNANTGTSTSNYPYISVVGNDSIEIIKIGADGQNGNVIVNGAAAAKWAASSSNKTIRGGSWDIVVNYNTLTGSGDYTITATTGDKSSVTNTFTSTASAVAGLASGNTSNNGAQGMGLTLPGYSVYQEDVTVPTAKYTVNYILADGTSVKQETPTGNVGAAPALEDSFELDGTTYYALSNDLEEGTTVSEGLVVNVTVRAEDVYAVSAVASTDSEVIFKSADVKEKGTFSYSYPKYLTDSSAKVVAAASDSTYTKTITPTESQTITVPYTEYEGTAYFVDHEAITNTTKLDSGNYSNGYASRAVTAGVNAFTVAEAGIYDITVAGSCRNTNNSSVFAVYKNSVSDENLIYNDDVIGASQNTVQSTGTKTKTDVELAAGDVIIIQGDNGNTWIDYVLAVKTADIEVPAEPDLVATLGETATVNGTEDKADTEATYFVITVANNGTAEGSYNSVSVTDGTNKFTAETPSATLAASATIVYGGIVDGAYSFNGASVQ